MSDTERNEISTKIKADITAWLLDNFEFTTEQKACMSKWPKSMKEETGFGIATALYYKEWELKVEIPDGNPPAGKKKKHTQSVSGAYNPVTGSYTVTKTHSISW